MSLQIKRFNWLPRQPAWRQLQNHRANAARFNSHFEGASNAANSLIYGGLSNQVLGSANNAAQAALTRVQKAGKALLDAHAKQIADAQSLLDRTQATGSAANSGSSSTGSMLDATV